MNAAPQQHDEQASEQEAFSLGLQAGRLRLAAPLNPFAFGTPQHQAWERARFNTIGAALARRAA